jgi:hypothetical protein
MKTALPALIFAAIALFGSPHEVLGQSACAEGTAASGECVKPQLAQAARQAAIIFAQPKLSYTAFPVLPSSDSFYRYPHELIPDPLKAAPLGPFILGPGGKVILVH